jgi:uncharacterized 2Fe-2S/4Fe-4S cluster protein (DUF4445 family)
MRGRTGAIEYVHIAENGEPTIITIGGGPPLGICGSGIVDLVAEMGEAGIIERSGKMNSSADRVKKDDAGKLAYTVCRQGDLGARQEIVFTQSDVRQVQLAKAAIRSGIDILLNETDMQIDDVDMLLLAGAFGTYIRPESAQRIGLLPQLQLDRIVPVGNAAGEGAKRLLVSKKMRRKAELIAGRTKYVDLATNANFQDILLSHISLPEYAGQ